MKNYRRLLALALASMMTITTVACGNTNTGSTGSTDAGSATTGTDAGDTQVAASSDEFRQIVLGSWWREYYDSTDESIEASADWTGAQDKDGDDEAKLAENAVNRQIAQAKWDLVEKLEQKYNCEYSWVNLTYDGTKESLTTSVLAGSPDADIYMVDTNMAVPAQANGLLVNLKDVLPEDDDLFTNQTVFSYLDLGDGKASILQRNGGMSNTYPLAFNKQMLEENNLEDPRDLYARGEWTWDKFLEYCEVLTQDTDGDGQIDQYGFAGFVKDTFSELLMSNGAVVCGGQTQTLTSEPVGETLDMLQKLFSAQYAMPYDYSVADYCSAGQEPGSPWDSMRIKYNDGNVGFFPIAVWIQDANGNYPMDNDGQGNLTWDVVYCRWPVGPSGDQATNPGVNAAGGNFFVIPAGVKDPAKVYNFLYDLNNWFDGDTSLRDNPATVTWWYNSTANKDDIKEANFAIQKECLNKPGFELYDALGIEMDLEGLINGVLTPAQIQETYKQTYQDALDNTFGG